MFILFLKFFIINTLSSKNIFILNNTIEDHILNIKNVNNNNLTETENKCGTCDIPGDINTIDELIKIKNNFYNYKILKTLENPNVSIYDKLLLIERENILGDGYSVNILKGLDIEDFFI